MERFDLKVESDLIKKFAKLLNQEMGITEEVAINTTFGVLDNANVAMVIPITEQAKRLLSRFVNPDRLDIKIPVLEYKSKYEFESKSKYSIEYLNKILGIFSVFEKYNIDSALKISIINNYPATFENKHFKVIIAPQIEQD